MVKKIFHREHIGGDGSKTVYKYRTFKQEQGKSEWGVKFSEY